MPSSVAVRILERAADSFRDFLVGHDPSAKAKPRRRAEGLWRAIAIGDHRRSIATPDGASKFASIVHAIAAFSGVRLFSLSVGDNGPGDGFLATHNKKTILNCKNCGGSEPFSLSIDALNAIRK
jgi:hypothetical protein